MKDLPLSSFLDFSSFWLFCPQLSDAFTKKIMTVGYLACFWSKWKQKLGFSVLLMYFHHS